MQAAAIPRIDEPVSMSGMDPPSNLLAGLRRGADDAVRRVMATELGGVYSVALGILGTQEDAEDACQEVFIRLLQWAPRLPAGTSLKGWLRRVCVNYCLDQRRGPSYRDRLLSVDDGMVDRTLPGPEQAAEEAGLRDALVRALRQLPARQRAVFVLRHFQECPLKEIAEILGCAQGTVKAHLSRAVSRLRVLLGDWRQPAQEASADD